MYLLHSIWDQDKPHFITAPCSLVLEAWSTLTYQTSSVFLTHALADELLSLVKEPGYGYSHRPDI